EHDVLHRHRPHQLTHLGAREKPERGGHVRGALGLVARVRPRVWAGRGELGEHPEVGYAVDPDIAPTLRQRLMSTPRLTGRALQTPRRSERTGVAVALLDTARMSGVPIYSSLTMRRPCAVGS